MIRMPVSAVRVLNKLILLLPYVLLVFPAFYLFVYYAKMLQFFGKVEKQMKLLNCIKLK